MFKCGKHKQIPCKWLSSLSNDLCRKFYKLNKFGMHFTELSLSINSSYVYVCIYNCVDLSI